MVEVELLQAFAGREPRGTDAAIAAMGLAGGDLTLQAGGHVRGDRTTARKLRQQLHRLPSRDPNDPGYWRLRYVRYADDTLLGFVGPRAEAEEIKQRIAQFLRDELKLELSETKTLITHARTQAARFLGYEIMVQRGDHMHHRGNRTVNGTIALRVPKMVITAKCARYLQRGKPAHRTRLVNHDDHTIIATYGAEYRGIVQYYLPAGDVWRLSRLHWVMETSMLKTLALKHRSTVSKMAREHRTTIDTPHGKRRCFEAQVKREGKPPLVARFGGIPLKRQKTAAILDRRPVPVIARKELINRLLTRRCEICGATVDIQVHHVRKLADLSQDRQSRKNTWTKIMVKRRRKTLIVCAACHTQIHSGNAALTQ